MSQLINEAFKELEGLDLDEELFSFDEKGARDLSYFLKSDTEPVLDIIDPLATEEDELQPSYEGDVICQCCVCRQLIYKKPEEIVIDEETQNANVGEECPHCYNTRGYKVIGQVEPYFDKEETKVTVDGDDVEVKAEEEEMTESLNESLSSDQLQTYMEDSFKHLGSILGRDPTYDELIDDLLGNYEGMEEYEFGPWDTDPALLQALRKKFPGLKEASDELEESAGSGKYVIYDVEYDNYFAGNIGGRYPNKVKSIYSATTYGSEREAQKIIDDFRSRKEFANVPRDRWVVREAPNAKESLKEADHYTGEGNINSGNPVEFFGAVSKDFSYLDNKDGTYDIYPADFDEFKKFMDLLEEHGFEFTKLLSWSKPCKLIVKEKGSKAELTEKWEDAYRQFTVIVDNNIENPDQIEKQVDALYAKHKGEKDWDFAYRRWMEGSDELTEDTVKTKKGWVNKGKSGTHGTFRTKKAADAQRKAMFASGYKGESLKEDLDEPIDVDTIKIKVKEEDITFFDEETGDIVVNEDNFKGTDVKTGDYVEVTFEDEEGSYDKSPVVLFKVIRKTEDGRHLEYIEIKESGIKDGLKEDLDPALVAKMNKESFVNYVTTRKGWTSEEAEDYLKTYFDEALDEKLTIEVTEEDINHFDEDTGDVVVDKTKFVGKDVEKGDYVVLKFTDESEDADTQEYKFVEETGDGFKLEWIGTKELHEDFQKATVETGNSILSMESDDDGKVTVTSEPRKAEEGGEETIAPLSDEVVAEIEGGEAEETEEEAPEEGAAEEEPAEGEAASEELPDVEDISIDEFEESYFNDLGKKYLQEVYSNVASYETTKGSIDGNKIKLEGIISFNSGKKVKTEFFFEGRSITKSGKVRFLGENAQITNKRNAFILTGSVSDGKLLTESLTYNYRAKDASTGKTVREYGTVRR